MELSKAQHFDQLEATMQMSLDEQKQYLLDRGAEAIFSYNQTDHFKNRIAIEVQWVCFI
jgi:hypothetical protein